MTIPLLSSQLRPALPASFLFHAVWVFAICGMIRNEVEHRLRRQYTKRAYKERERTHIKETYADHWFWLRGIWRGLTMHRQRTMAPKHDRITATLIHIQNVLLILLFIGFVLLGLSANIESVLPAAAALVIAECLLCFGWTIRHLFLLPKRARDPNERISIPALWLRYGYALAATLCLAVERVIPAALLMIANGIHLLIARAYKCDHYYCFVQSISHRPMTPHHHSASSRNNRKNEKDMRNTAILLILIGVALLCLFLFFDSPQHIR